MSAEPDAPAVLHAKACVELARQIVDDIRQEKLSLDDARRIAALAREAAGWFDGIERLLDTGHAPW